MLLMIKVATSTLYWSFFNEPSSVVSSGLLVMFVESKLVMLAIKRREGLKLDMGGFASDFISAASNVHSPDKTHSIRHFGFLAVGLCVNFPRHFNKEDN